MSPFHPAITSVGRFVASFHPKALPPMLRASFARELAAWWLLPIMLGAVEGGAMGNIVKKAFENVHGIHRGELDLVVAMVQAGPAVANISSFLWASLAHGRTKVKFIVGLQLATAAMVALIGAAQEDRFGLYLVAFCVIFARIFWSGVVTIRTAVWGANYPRADRARIAGKLATVQALMLSLVGLAMGSLMDVNEELFHIVFPVCALFGLIGTWIYSKVRLRGQKRLARAEKHGDRRDRPTLNPASIVRVLRGDPLYRRFMLWMFIFGIGNLMIAPPLIIALHDRLDVSYLSGIMITSGIPSFFMPLTIPLWARLMDRSHVVRFRSIHAWSFVTVSVLMLIAAALRSLPLFFVAAAATAVAHGGGVLAWNLGHHDFAPPGRDSHYMGVHVTLTGVRGILAPFLAVGIYKLFEHLSPGSGYWVFAVCIALNLIGALGFVSLSRRLDSIGWSPHGIH